MKVLEDGEARRRIEEDLDQTFVVEAAAGTGKTTALIGRMIALLRTGRARLEEIVAVTFTEKAAGEMKLRLRAALERAHADAGDDAERARFEAALAELEAARIGTIHSFCADLLRERPVEAGVDPALEVLSEDESRELIGRAFQTWFQQVLDDPPEGVRRMLRRQGKAPRQRLLSACRDLAGRRDHDAPLRRDPFEREARIDEALEGLRGLAALAALARSPSDYLGRALARVGRFIAELDERERTRPRDYDGLEAELVELRRGYRNRSIWTHFGRGREYGEKLLRQDVIARRDAVAERLDALATDAEADLAACLARDLAPVVAGYEALKAKSGTLDFLDLLIRVRDLLVTHEPVREALRARIRAIFVDEFQDTDPLQAEILLVLASDGAPAAGGPLAEAAAPPAPGKLFVVGDPKQSIYRFRRADVALYERVKRKLLAQGVELLTLSTSFRATPDLQRVINTAFAPLMQGAEDGSQASYVPLGEHRPAPRDRPSVVALPVPRPYGRYGKVFKKAVAASTADAVGAFVDWLLSESGYAVDDGATGLGRPIESRDVCLLFRSTSGFGQNLVTPYVLALEARGVPHVMVGGRAFHDREEVLALATVLRAIEHPGDALSVYATLRGPFFALGDDELLVHDAAEGLHPLKVREGQWGERRDPVADALELLRALHFQRNRRPVADTLASFLDATRAHAAIANWPNGEQALANVLRVLELARRFEAQGATSFRAFVERIEDQLERGEGLDAPAVEERAAGVRVMTVHSAKGLEFPVVVLCDPTLPRTSERPSRFVDPERRAWAAPIAGCVPVELAERREEVLRADDAEEVRLTYVAATRARDLLVVPCVGDGPEPGWVDPLHRALYPEADARRASAPAPGCPPFGEDSVLERGDEVPFGTQRSVRPGLHRIAGADVVWWDPAVLGLGRVPKGGLRGTAIFEEGGDDGRLEAYLAWTTERQATREAGSAPSFRVRSVTKVAHEIEEGGAPSPLWASSPRIEEVSALDEARPGGKRFGTLVHAVLAECALDADPAALSAMARHQGALLAAPDDEVRAAIELARATLEHPILREAREAEARGECRRESPITVPLEDGTSAEGVVDLAYRKAGGGWVIVDFKTDRERGAKLTHAVQLAVYARAVGGATGEPTETVLLYL